MATTKAINATDKIYMQLNSSELSAMAMKGSPNSIDRDAGFCSGSSEGGDDDHSRLDQSSPTDASEVSVDVKMMPIALIRNKRKSSEPSKVVCERDEAISAFGPLKKRIRYTSNTDSALVVTPPAIATPSPAPPTQLWDPSQVLPHEYMPHPAHVYVRHPGVTTLHRVPQTDDYAEQVEPLALVLRKPANKDDAASSTKVQKLNTTATDKQTTTEDTLATATLVPPRPLASVSVVSSNDESIDLTMNGNSSSCSGAGGARPTQRNYKNMTRERRIEANARERTRVHTISAAYETLRRSVPAYSHAQKLSKLSVLRVACSYILTLSRMAGYDYSEDQSAPSIASCFDAVTATIQTEGKIRKKKDE